jgi:hypothetical protein
MVMITVLCKVRAYNVKNTDVSEGTNCLHLQDGRGGQCISSVCL